MEEFKEFLNRNIKILKEYKSNGHLSEFGKGKLNAYEITLRIIHEK